MKQINIKIKIDDVDEKIGWAIQHLGFSANERYSLEQILITLGALENIKTEMQKKLSTFSSTSLV